MSKGWMRRIGALCASAALGGVLPGLAQEGAGPPKVLRIVREQIKQGREAAHAGVEASYMRLLAKYKYPATILGCGTYAGPSQVWFFEGHDSYASIESADAFVRKNAALAREAAGLDQMDGDLRDSSATMIAVLRDDMSYRADQFAQELPKTRFFSMIVARVHPGMEPRMAEIAKQGVAAYRQANVTLPLATYQVMEGAPEATFLLVRPLKSLGDLDAAREQAGAIRQALGAERAEGFYKSESEALAAAETVLLEIGPGMSHVPKEFAAEDVDFWTPKPAPAPAKPRTTTPAAKKPAATP